MTSTDVLNPPSVEVPQHMHSMEGPLSLPLVAEAMDHASLKHWQSMPSRIDALESLKFLNGFAAAVDSAHERPDVIAAGGYHPVDRGPALAESLKALRSWQYHVTGKVAAAAVLMETKAEHVKSGGPKSLAVEASRYILEHKLDDTFYVVDLGNVTRMFKAWRAAMPRVIPHYAVKCNPEPGMVKLLVALGAGFDCASKGELDMMLKLGVPPSKIIFAHPCKRACDIRFAQQNGIEYTTFDTESELHKIATMNPDFKCVLRIRADDPEARVPLGLKYGADMADVPRLLTVAKQLGLQIVGVSFHVGSACKNLAVFHNAIEAARAIFDQAEAMGNKMELLDIGGGFTGHFDEMGNVMFGDIATAINTALNTHFPADCGVRVIAEPGRYFAETSATLFTPVYGHRDRMVDGSMRKDYWLTDGLYGSFNCIIYDGQNPSFQVVRSPMLPRADDISLYKSTLWGPTCDSADCVYKDVMLPQLRNGDWLMFPNAGAYTVAGACDFNGIEFTTPTKFYVYSDIAVDEVDHEVEAAAAAGIA